MYHTRTPLLQLQCASLPHSLDGMQFDRNDTDALLETRCWNLYQESIGPNLIVGIEIRVNFAQCLKNFLNGRKLRSPANVSYVAKWLKRAYTERDALRVSASCRIRPIRGITVITFNWFYVLRSTVGPSTGTTEGIKVMYIKVGMFGIERTLIWSLAIFWR